MCNEIFQWEVLFRVSGCSERFTLENDHQIKFHFDFAVFGFSCFFLDSVHVAVFAASRMSPMYDRIGNEIHDPFGNINIIAITY